MALARKTYKKIAFGSRIEKSKKIHYAGAEGRSCHLVNFITRIDLSFRQLAFLSIDEDLEFFAKFFHGNSFIRVDLCSCPN